MVHSRLDYANSLVHGHTNVKRLQSVQNSAARVVSKDNHNLSSGDLLRKLHWLPVQSRIELKIACITYKVLTTGQPTYLSTLLNHYTVYTSAHFTLQLISTFCSTRGFPLSLPRRRSVTSHLKFGTIYAYPSTSGFALVYPTNLQTSSQNVPIQIVFTLHSRHPRHLSHSDCLRLRFSMFADIVRLTNACIIILL